MGIEPVTRKEMFMAAAAGENVTAPTPVTREEYFLSKIAGSGGGGGGGVQPDWNQNDSAAADYVRNRPFYTGDPVETVLVEESTVSFAEEGGAYAAELESTFSATVGETYRVYWDGTAYECTCVASNGRLYIGNLSFVGAGSDTGEPFIMMVLNGAGIYIITTDTSASHTFSISISGQPQIVKIPSKYIDKDTSGYIVIHKNYTMTEQEAQNYMTAISTKEVGIVMWGGLYIRSFLTEDGYMYITTINGEEYSIKKNNEGVFSLANKGFDSAVFPYNALSTESYFMFKIGQENVGVERSDPTSGVGTAVTMFYVKPTGTKSKAFEVLGNGEAVAPALILYSSTANSTKKFRITVDDNGTISATEVT